jgi:adenine phosphoribosyltransferase
VEYALEYGSDSMEMHLDAIKPGERVMLVDDLIATGGTAVAALQLLQDAGAEIVAAVFVVDLPELGGADKLRAAGVPVSTLVAFGGH